MAMGTENLTLILRWLYPNADPMKDWQVDDDGTGPRIVRWSVPNVPQPSLLEVITQEGRWKASQRRRRPVAAILADLEEWIGPQPVQNKASKVALLVAAELTSRDPQFLRRHDIPVDGDEPA